MTTQESTIQHLNENTFDEAVSQSEQPLLVDFWAPWCGPCQAFGSILDKAAAQLGDDAIVAKVNVDDLRDIALEYRVTSIPTVLYFADGQLQHREAGIVQENAIVDRVNSFTANA